MRTSNTTTSQKVMPDWRKCKNKRFVKCQKFNSEVNVLIYLRCILLAAGHTSHRLKLIEDRLCERPRRSDYSADWIDGEWSVAYANDTQIQIFHHLSSPFTNQIEWSFNSEMKGKGSISYLVAFIYGNVLNFGLFWEKLTNRLETASRWQLTGCWPPKPSPRGRHRLETPQLGPSMTDAQMSPRGR